MIAGYCSMLHIENVARVHHSSDLYQWRKSITWNLIWINKWVMIGLLPNILSQVLSRFSACAWKFIPPGLEPAAGCLRSCDANLKDTPLRYGHRAMGNDVHRFCISAWYTISACFTCDQVHERLTDWMIDWLIWQWLILLSLSYRCVHRSDTDKRVRVGGLIYSGDLFW